ncbi:MAG: Gfo/Idh/MocA family oxidoreductase, partial [Candidatus Omnitrophica bacterium]|nr:Gfo/Idh/MocA family oxidoreductase [Candidatus Omnitrophota bacterium]
MTLKACVIGDSQQGGYGHAFDTAFTDYEEIEIVGLADPDDAGRQTVGNKIGAKNLYSDYREMLQQERPDLVAIGPRWPIHHRDYLLAAAEVGAHGFLEKPISVDLA